MVIKIGSLHDSLSSTTVAVMERTKQIMGQSSIP